MRMIFGYYNDGKLQYVARTRNGFTPSYREQLFKKLKPLEVKKCPFANLPEARSGRWGAGLTAAKMKDCQWLLCRMRHSSHNVECRTMPHVFWAHDFGGGLTAICTRVALILVGIAHPLKGFAETKATDRPA